MALDVRLRLYGWRRPVMVMGIDAVDRSIMTYVKRDAEATVHLFNSNKARRTSDCPFHSKDITDAKP